MIELVGNTLAVKYLSRKTLSKTEISLLSKGLKFVPTAKEF